MSNTDRAMGPESPVTTGISRKGLSVGTVGVLGPTRMNDPQALAAVAVVGQRQNPHRIKS